jgi:hypothetical protein
MTFDTLSIYGGDPIPFDASGVLPLVENPTISTYANNPTALHACNTFNYTYTNILKSLQATFNGSPDQIDDAIALMESLKNLAIDLVNIDLGNGTNAGPSFEYQPINPDTTPPA